MFKLRASASSSEDNSSSSFTGGRVSAEAVGFLTFFGLVRFADVDVFDVDAFDVDAFDVDAFEEGANMSNAENRKTYHINMFICNRRNEELRK